MKKLVLPLLLLVFSFSTYALDSESREADFELPSNETQELGTFETIGLFQLVQHPLPGQEGYTCMIKFLKDNPVSAESVKVVGTPARTEECSNYFDDFNEGCPSSKVNYIKPWAVFGKAFLAPELCTLDNIVEFDNKIVAVSGTLQFFLEAGPRSEYDRKAFKDLVSWSTTYTRFVTTFAGSRLFLLSDTSIQILKK